MLNYCSHFAGCEFKQNNYFFDTPLWRCTNDIANNTKY